MTTTLDDPFGLEVDPLERDRWDRPLIVPPKGGDKEPYTRASTLANYLTDHSGLATWEKRLIAVGLGQREDLCALAASLPRLHAEKVDKSSLTAQQKREDSQVNKQLDEIIELAKEAACGSFKARFGTTIHNLTDPGADVEMAPERMKADVQSWWDFLAKHDIEILATEQFVVNDELKVAGTFDHLAYVPGYGVCVIDKKTGQVDGKSLSFAVQLSAYANSLAYDCHTNERAPLESLTDGQRVSRQVGFIAHIPLGGAKTTFYRVDLLRGYHCARLATTVRAARGLKDLCAEVTL